MQKKKQKQKKTKKKPPLCFQWHVQKTALRDTFFIFHFIDGKTVMRNLFINRTGWNTHKNNAVGRDLSLWYLFHK